MSQPRISLVMPVWNSEKYLAVAVCASNTATPLQPTRWWSSKNQFSHALNTIRPP